MADPLSIAASVVGIAQAALKSVQYLSNTIGSIRDAPDAVKGIRDDLQAVEPVLRSLHTALQGDCIDIVLSDEIKPAVENCNRACLGFQSKLDHFTRHSTAEKTFWKDRWRVGFFGQDRINGFKRQLNDCKSTLSVALLTANIITTTRQEYIMKDMKDVLLKQHEDRVRQEIVRAKDQAAEIDSSLQQLTIGRGHERSQLEQSGQELLQEVLHQQASSNTLRKLCEEALSRTVYERTGQKIKGVKATNYSLALTGFINTSGEESNIKQDISDVSADNRSVVVVGVVKDLNLRDLHPSGLPTM